MSTPAQIAANRANAKRSTGPRSEAGKMASSRNNLRHGLCAKQIVLPGEKAADYEALRQELHSDYAPANTAEATLVDQIAEHTWRLQRVRRAETAMFEKLMRDMDDDLAIARAIANPEGDLDRIRRYEVTIERSYHRAIEQLRKLQKERRAAENSASASGGFARMNGFVSPEPMERATAVLAALLETDPAPPPAPAPALRPEVGFVLHEPDSAPRV
jgi:hypothetical protein